MISSCVRETLGIAKAHMSPGAVNRVMSSAALAFNVPCDWAKVATPARYYISIFITTQTPPTFLISAKY